MTPASQNETLTAVGRTTFLTALVNRLDRAKGADLILPILATALLATAPFLLLRNAWMMLHPYAVTVPDPGLSLLPALAGFVLVPVMQAVLLRFLLFCLGKYIPQPDVLALTVALLCGAMASAWPIEALSTVWVAYVIATCFLRLQARSLEQAYRVTMLILAAVNLLAYGITVAR